MLKLDQIKKLMTPTKMIKKIPINVTGIIQSSNNLELVGWTVFVEAQKNTISNCESYQVYYNSPDNNKGYDDWILNEDELINLFERNRFEVNWNS